MSFPIDFTGSVSYVRVMIAILNTSKTLLFDHLGIMSKIVRLRKVEQLTLS